MLVTSIMSVSVTALGPTSVAGSLSCAGALSSGALTCSGTLSCGTNAATCGALSSSSISNAATLVNAGNVSVRTTGTTRSILFHNSDGTTEYGGLAYAASSNQYFTGAAAGDIVLRATTADKRVLVGQGSAAPCMSLTDTDVSLAGTLTFPNGGATGLSWYEEKASTSLSLTASNGTTTTNYLATRIGNVVTLHFLAYTNAGNSNATVYSAAIPAQFRPSADRLKPLIIADGGTYKMGCVRIAATGVLTWGNLGSAPAVFVGTAAWPSQSITYRLA